MPVLGVNRSAAMEFRCDGPQGSRRSRPTGREPGECRIRREYLRKCPLQRLAALLGGADPHLDGRCQENTRQCHGGTDEAIDRPPSKTIKVVDMNSSDNPNRSIIYFCPCDNTPIGGIKVLIRHSELINSMSLNGIDSSVYFPTNPKYNVTWFDHSAKIKRNNSFCNKSDFIVIPEVWAVRLGIVLNNLQFKFGIFVQNGYIFRRSDDDYVKFCEAYEAASVILSISEETTECIKLAFPQVDSKILRVQYSIRDDIFYPKDKENVITYMTRKMPQHVTNVISFLQIDDIKNWQFKTIHNKSEREVGEILGTSKIFLSFSELEGLPVPPLEAAMSGNSVIGYTGEGGKEYWFEGVFTQIESGNIREFVREIRKKIEELSNIESVPGNEENFKRDICKIRCKYSSKNEVKLLRVFMDRVNVLMGDSPEGGEKCLCLPFQNLKDSWQKRVVSFIKRRIGW